MSQIATQLVELPDDSDRCPCLGTVVQLPVAAAAPAQRVLAVEFGSPDGRRWGAIGGGPNVAAAIADARESCPAGTWEAVGWNDLYGE